MNAKQTLADYYSVALPPLEPAYARDGGYFAAYPLEELSADNLRSSALYCRRDFYKMVLLTGDATYHVGDRHERVAPGQYALVFTNRQVPYSWEVHRGVCHGYGCVFTEDFLPLHTYRRPADWTVFDPAGPSFFRLTPAQAGAFAELFAKMIAAQTSAYPQKHELLFLYLLEGIHGALQLAPAAQPSPATAATRLTEAFRGLLAQQFPLVTPQQRLTLRTPQAFADQLAVHVNYLTRTLKAVTGQTTSQLLAERIVQEARALLRHSDWSISQISYCLGFEEPTHFAQFFRRHTQYTPSQLRQV